MHLTSLPGAYGIGDLGCERGHFARQLIDWLADSGQTFWQVLPISPTGFADSPYQSFSSFAGNANLISLDALETNGWLTQQELNDRPAFRASTVDYGSVIKWHDELLTLAYERFVVDGGYSDVAFRNFIEANAGWLDDFALFMVLKEENDSRAWFEWPEEYALRNHEHLDHARDRHHWRVYEEMFRQWIFFTQWRRLKEYAESHNVRIIGDIPIYVAHDSCDLWVNRDQKLFDVDARGALCSVAGVPPDYYSITGQRWGNPIYLWDQHAATNYGWWKRRLAWSLALFDVVRIDHFRCLYNYWQIAVDEQLAVNGSWRPGPRDSFLRALDEDVRRRIVAEDLGDAMEPVRVWKDSWGIPGMKVLQFAFGGRDEDRRHFKPVPYRATCKDDAAVIYTSTQDSNTAVGWWYADSTPDERLQMSAMIRQWNNDDQYEIREPHWDMIHLGMESQSLIFIVPMQDILGLGPRARMNTCGKRSGNWRWRCTAEEFTAAPWQRLATLTRTSNRWRRSGRNQ